jgi:hypothetical protein
VAGLGSTLPRAGNTEPEQAVQECHQLYVAAYVGVLWEPLRNGRCSRPQPVVKRPDLLVSVLSIVGDECVAGRALLPDGRRVKHA